MHPRPMLLPAVLLVSWFCGPADAQTTTRVSLDSHGAEGNRASITPVISGSGRWVAFTSDATNLVSGDRNGCKDVFLRDRGAGATLRVSVSASGGEGNADSDSPALTPDGRFVAFRSSASTLVDDDHNGRWDVFVHEVASGITTRVSVDAQGHEGNGESYDPAFSADARWIAFDSFASNLTPGDTASADVFVRELQSGAMVLVSTDSRGNPGNDWSMYPSLSADGRFVAFDSYATNLVGDDTNRNWDVFVKDRLTGVTTRVSVDSQGHEGNGDSQCKGLRAISADGRFVVFNSSASNLVPDDSNGTEDVFLHDRETHETRRISVAASGQQGNDLSLGGTISSDGRTIAFMSRATNLVPADTNDSWDVFVWPRDGGAIFRASVDPRGAQVDGDSNSPSLSSDASQVGFDSASRDLSPSDFNVVRDAFVRTLFEDCSGDGYVLSVPPQVAIGTAFDLCVWTGPGDLVFLMVASGTGPTSTPYGTFCIDLPPLALIAFSMSGSGRCFHQHVPCDSRLIGAVGYLQFLALDAGTRAAGLSNQREMTVIDGSCQ